MNNNIAQQHKRVEEAEIGISNELKFLKNHLISCTSNRISGLLPICCANMFTSVQTAKNVFDMHIAELHRLATINTNQ